MPLLFTSVTLPPRPGSFLAAPFSTYENFAYGFRFLFEANGADRRLALGVLSALAIVLVAYPTIWVAYRFRYEAIPGVAAAPFDEVLPAHFERFKREEPAAKIGYSIFVYRMKEDWLSIP